jgi:hypothetical protein
MSEFVRLRRPKFGDTDEDLMEQQRQFESSESSIAPQNIRNLSGHSKTSKFAADRQQAPTLKTLLRGV